MARFLGKRLSAEAEVNSDFHTRVEGTDQEDRQNLQILPYGTRSEGRAGGTQTKGTLDRARPRCPQDLTSAPSKMLRSLHRIFPVRD